MKPRQTPRQLQAGPPTERVSQTIGRRPHAVYTARVDQAMRTIPRQLFVPPGLEHAPSDEEPVPLCHDRTLPPAGIVAKMLGALDLDGSEGVLEVGGGSGYQAALLGRLAREVTSIESDPALAASAASALAKLGITNVRIVHADPSGGWTERAPYQAILVDLAAADLPAALLAQLDSGGRLVIALGDERGQLIERFCKTVDSLKSETIGACHLDVLDGAQRSPSSFPWTHPH